MGVVRLFLALAVVAGHCNSKIFGLNWPPAFAAVNFFFIISGFYMSMVLNTKYKKVPVTKFYISRALRIFPIYYLGILLMFIVKQHQITDFFMGLNGPSRIYQFLSNIFIFGQELPYIYCFKDNLGVCAPAANMTINPPAWSLSVELGFYLIAPFIVRSSKYLISYLFIGILYTLSLNAITFPIPTNSFLSTGSLSSFNYIFYPASFMFFGIGALAYRLKNNLTTPKYIVTLIGLGTMTFLKLNMPFWEPIIFALALPSLFEYTKNSSLDKFIGDTSYPVYILHFPILIFIGGLEPSLKYLSPGNLVAITSIVFAILCNFFIEKPINRVRAKLSKFYAKELLQ